MEGVTSAIVLFVFVCVLFPRLIDSRPQYYIAFVLTLLIVLLTPIAAFAGRGMLIAIGAMQVIAIVLLFLSAGGLTVRGLTREMAGAFEVIRRGETEKEILIPIGNEQKEKRRKSAVESMGQPLERYNLSTEEGEGAAYPPKRPQSAQSSPPPPPASPSTPPAERKPREDDDGPIPLD